MAEQEFLIGLDLGNTVTKAVLFDTDGHEAAVATRVGTSYRPSPGRAERDANELWEHVIEVIRQCLAEADIDPALVCGIGVSGHGNGLYLLDRAKQPLPVVQAIDTRAAATAEAFAAEKGADLHAICLQLPWASQTPSLLAWAKQNMPEMYSTIGTVFLCKDFVNFRLTGNIATEISDMSGAGLLRMPEAVYDENLLAMYGIEDIRQALPPLSRPTDVVGGLCQEAAEATGLSLGTPVVGGLFDVVACAVGSGAEAPGQTSLISGTWGINQVVTSAPVVNPDVFMVSAFGPDRYLNLDASATSAANLEWYVRQLVERSGHHDDPFGAVNALVQSVKPALDDPFYHPFLHGSGEGAHWRAGFYGIAGWHTEGHMLRALFEGVVFEHRRHVECIRGAGEEFEVATLSGGAARSPHWPQMFADVLGIPVTVSGCHEVGALGAAITAGVGVGHFPSFTDGIKAMTSSVMRFEPNAEIKRHYDVRYQVYRELGAAMKPFWNRLRMLRD